MKLPVLLLMSLLASLGAYGQTFRVSGVLQDAGSGESLIGVNVVLNPLTDMSKEYGASTDAEGRFVIEGLAPAIYRLQATYIGYKALRREVRIETADIDLGTVKLEEDAVLLKDVEIAGVSTRAEQKGDTTQYNADAFKVNKDASAEDLIGKMPGIQVENGTVKSQGENVKRVLVDGKPFFGDDATLALKNLPADAIDKIQVFDRLSDQAQFTGFDDGNAEKTINIVTKPSFNGAQFGKVFAGYGTDNRYQAGINDNFFQGDRKISLIAQSNNINQQNFAQQDLAGISGGGGGGRPPGGGGGGRPPGGGGGRPGGGDNSGNFLVGQQGGISTTHSIGLNYTDEWNKKLKLNGSYFFNYSENNNDRFTNRSYITAQDSGLVYSENNLQSATNLNHRLNFRLEYEPDTSNSIIFTPRLSWQNNKQDNQLQGSNTLLGELLNTTENTTQNDNRAYNLGAGLVLQHKFNKRGRSISLDLNGSVNDRKGEGSLHSLTQYLGDVPELITFDQVNDSKTNSWSTSGNLSYTEPLGKSGQLQINYNPSFNRNTTDKYTYNFNSSEGIYNDLDSLLSNAFENDYLTQRAGLSYRFRGEKFNGNLGVNYQDAKLISEQVFPSEFNTQARFKNWLPNARYQHNFSKTSSLRVNYRANTNAPSISQLQRVVNNNNPLQLSTGNPDLVQDYQHSVFARFNRTNPVNANSFFSFLSFTLTEDYIGSSTFIAPGDTVLPDGTALSRGAQITRPVNLDGYRNARAFLTFGFPIKAIKCNLNLNTGFTYSRLPGQINEQINISDNTNFSQGFTLGSNISQNLDFTLNYNGSFNIVKNSIQSQADNNYFSQTMGLRFNWQFLRKWVISSDINNTLYSGLSDAFNQRYTLWNASFGRKFLADDKLDVRLAVFDLLNQNNSIGRTVNEVYLEDTETRVLQRYGMLVLTYRLNTVRK